jgi:hypothetical protein
VRHLHTSLALRAQCRTGVALELLVHSGGVVGRRAWLALSMSVGDRSAYVSAGALRAWQSVGDAARADRDATRLGTCDAISASNIG